MSNEGIEEEERIAQERMQHHVDELIRGTVREIGALRNTGISLTSSASVTDAVTMMIEHRVGVILVIDEGQLCGLFSERDVITRVVSQGLDPQTTPLQSVLTPNPQKLSLDHEIVYALNTMTVGGYRHIPIIDDTGAAVAVLSMRDVMEHIVEFYSDEVYNLPDAPDRTISPQREGA